MPQDPNALIWIDLEMSGLNTETDKIIEIATIFTDSHLNIIAQGPVLAVHQPDGILNTMDEWNTRTHGGSGLTQRVRESTLTEADAERLTLEFIQEYVPKNRSPLCGNSICQDRRFLVRGMPNLESYLHYRNLDVSTLKGGGNGAGPRVGARRADRPPAGGPGRGGRPRRAGQRRGEDPAVHWP